MSTKIHAAYTPSSARQIPLCWPFLSGPKPPQHERQSVCCVVAGDLYGPCRQLQMNHSPKKHKLGRFFFPPPKKLVFFHPTQKFPHQQIKSKLLKDWVHSCFDFFFFDTLLCLKEISQRGNALKTSIAQATWHSASVWFWGRVSGRDREGVKRQSKRFGNLLWNSQHFQFSIYLKF